MPTIIETIAYEYNELSDEAKETARDKVRESGVLTDNDWWDFTVDNFVSNITRLFDFEVLREDVFFSGFYSKGDGASFEGLYTGLMGDNSKTYLSRVNSAGFAGKYEERLQEIAETLDIMGNEVAAILRNDNVEDYGISDIPVSLINSRYYHENTMSVDVFDCIYIQFYDDGDSDKDERETYSNVERIIEEAVTDAARELARILYRSLSEEYDYILSDEHVEEFITINAYMFNEDGTII